MLTITFVLLKVFEYIDWSWIWIFAPIWIPIALILLFLTITGILQITIGDK